ncbi:MAG: hypothetical protein HY923_00900 [Elusimicrobia bacterium]|nr:hypothetical protein [Elusimicrobiota bacterium]
MLRAAAFALALSAFAQSHSGTWDPALGKGATGLLGGALAHMQTLGHVESCLSGMMATVNIYHPADRQDPRSRAGAINSFDYYFFSPAKPHRTVLSINEPIDGGPLPQNSRYHEYDPQYIGDSAERGGVGFSHIDVRETCISELRVDSSQALAVAAKNGLPLGTMTAYRLHLLRASAETESDWKDRALRQKTFWVVYLSDRDVKTVRQFLIDAVTGKFLKSRVVRNPLLF